MVLLSPLQGKPDNPWIGIYFRIFHILMIPSVVMLVLAVSKRINQYGLTEPRYLLLILSGWVKVILVVGLWSRHSQMSRVQNKLADADLFSHGQLMPTQSDSTSADRTDLTIPLSI